MRTRSGQSYCYDEDQVPFDMDGSTASEETTSEETTSEETTSEETTSEETTSEETTSEEEEEDYDEEEEEEEEEEHDDDEEQDDKDWTPTISDVSMSGGGNMPFVIIATTQGGATGRCAHKRKRSSDDPPPSFYHMLSHNEQTYYDNLDVDAQRELERTYECVFETPVCVPTPLRFRVLRSSMDQHTKRVVLKRIAELQAMSESGGEGGEFHKLKRWINRLCDVPFGIYTPMKIDRSSTSEEVRRSLDHARETLDKNVYGHRDAKDQIVRIMAQWIANPCSKGNVIGIQGNPGVGKTTLVQSGICDAIGLPFANIPLGGCSDSSYLDGHSFTYEGSTCGRIVELLTHAGCMNPVLYFDELDKVSDTARGREIVNVLIHLTDPSQNNAFRDKYFSEIKFDLSKCLIVFTYNNKHLIDPILLDRMITIHTMDFNVEDKVEIARRHLVPSVMSQFGFDPRSIRVTDDTLRSIVGRVAKEAGVRNLKRAIEAVISNINLERLMCSESANVNEMTMEHVNKHIRNVADFDNPSAAHIYM